MVMRRAHQVRLPWVRVDRDLGISAERQICGALRQAIRQGLLSRGFRLPSLRQLARDLDVSRRVIANAYERLEAEGYVASNRGGGTHVAADAVLPRRAAACIAPSSRARSMPPARAGDGDFAWRRWLQCLERAPGSTLDLREVIATQLCPARGIVATPEEIVLAMHRDDAIACAARLLADPGDTVRIDGDSRTAALYEHLGLRIAGAAPRIIHIAAALAPGKQYLLLRDAKSIGAAIVEEEHGERPLKAIDSEGRVLYIRCFPAGVALLIVPLHLAALAANLVTPAPALLQNALAEFIASGHANVTSPRSAIRA